MTRKINAKKYPSFVAQKRGGRGWWNVKATGNHEKDGELGLRLALEYLAYEERDRGGAGCLQLIVERMPRKLTMVEIAFLQMVSFAAGAGAYRARQISEYWDRCRKEHEAA